MIFSGQANPFIFFRGKEKIHINYKNSQIPHKITEIMKKQVFLASFILGGFFVKKAQNFM